MRYLNNVEDFATRRNFGDAYRSSGIANENKMSIFATVVNFTTVKICAI